MYFTSIATSKTLLSFRDDCERDSETRARVYFVGSSASIHDCTLFDSVDDFLPLITILSLCTLAIITFCS